MAEFVGEIFVFILEAIIEIFTFTVKFLFEMILELAFSVGDFFGSKEKKQNK